MKSRLPMFLATVAVMLFGAVFVPVNAQDAPATTTLEDVTADSASYYGSEVTLEGVVETFVNVNMFVLAEGAALDDDRVLVINSSGQPFAPDIVIGDRVFVTGVVQPSRDEYNGGTMPMTVTPDISVEPTVDPNLMTTPDTSMATTPEGGAVDMATPDAAMEPTIEGADMTTPDAAMEPTVEGADMTTPDTAMEPTVEGADVATPDAMATPMGEDLTPQIDALSFFYGYPTDLLNGYNDYTILQVTHAAAIMAAPDTE